MASSGKSEKLGLSLWEASDRPERLDFRQDNERLEQLIGGHLADAGLHLTPEQKNYLKKPYAAYVYNGTGSTLATRVGPCIAKAVLVMCSDSPPIVPRSDGKYDVYWDFWANINHTLSGRHIWGLGGVGMVEGTTSFQTGSKDCEKDSRFVLKLNERGKFYVAIFFPELS